jgi:hypothetical protein
VLLNDGALLARIIFGSLKSMLDAHGPVTWHNLASAEKRIRKSIMARLSSETPAKCKRCKDLGELLARAVKFVQEGYDCNSSELNEDGVVPKIMADDIVHDYEDLNGVEDEA